MADAIALPQNPPISLSSKFLRLLPELVLLAAIGFAGKLLEKNINAYAKAHHWPFPNIEYVLWAILIGLVISNVFGVAEIFRPGVATYEFWLKAGIVLLGSCFLLGDVAKLGGVSLVLVATEIAGSLAFMTFLGRVFGLKPKLTALLAVGSRSVRRQRHHSDAGGRSTHMKRIPRSPLLPFWHSAPLQYSPFP